MELYDVLEGEHSYSITDEEEILLMTLGKTAKWISTISLSLLFN